MPLIPVILHHQHGFAPTLQPAASGAISRSGEYGATTRLLSSAEWSYSVCAPPKPAHDGGHPLATSSSGSAASQGSVAKSDKRKRKSDISNWPNYGAVVTPQFEPIISRCMPARHHTAADSAVGATKANTSPRKGKSADWLATSTDHDPYGTLSAYNPLLDRGNDRSIFPSPKEIRRAQRLEEEKAQAKKDNAAAARAAIALKRRKGTRKRGGTATPRGGSPVKDAQQNAGSTATDVAAVPPPSGARTNGTDTNGKVPALRTEPPSGESSPPAQSSPQLGGNPRLSLKRTRSTGLIGISTATANALAPGNLGVGSPLRSVIGPDGEEMDEDESARQASGVKKSRRSSSTSTAAKSGSQRARIVGLGIRNGSDIAEAAPRRSGRKASSHSPPSGVQPLPNGATPPSTFPLAAGRLQPARRTSAGGEPDSVGMRRVVSAAGGRLNGGGHGVDGDSRTRGVSAGPDGLANGAVARERSRRESVLPKALRDYDVRAGGPF